MEAGISPETEQKIYTSPAEFLRDFEQSELFKKEYDLYLKQNPLTEIPEGLVGTVDDFNRYRYYSSDNTEYDLERFAKTSNICLKIRPAENPTLADDLKAYKETRRDREKAELAGDQNQIRQLDAMQRKYHNEAALTAARQLESEGVIKSTRQLFGDEGDDVSYPRGLSRGIIVVAAKK